MMTLPELATDALEEFLGSYMRRRFGSSQAMVPIVTGAARLALECIGGSDALFGGMAGLAGLATGSTRSRMTVQRG
jgi:hypothetical protein